MTFFIGVIVGALLGIFYSSLCVISKRSDEEAEKMLHKEEYEDKN